MTTLAKKYLDLFQNNDLKKSLLNKTCEKLTEEEILRYCLLIENALKNLTFIELEILNIVNNYDCFGQVYIYRILINALNIPYPNVK